ncbi:MAG: hypothetical protein LBD02_08770 [Christensenellaceae bacterium]|nr:hypothetical protein [Christensenellaceae bacterium]
MTKSKIFSLLLALFLLAAALAACTESTPAAAPPSEAPQVSAKPTKLQATISNQTDYNFFELYVSPTAANEWGEDHMGSTSILKKNGSFQITLQAYEFSSYDVRIVDEDSDEYLFERVSIVDGTKVTISFSEDGLVATSVAPSGAESSVIGALNGESVSGGSDPGDTGSLDGYGTNGQFGFSIYNESDYDIYAIYMGPSTSGSENDVDILPSILNKRQSTTVSGRVNQADWASTEWTLFIVDVDDDTSSSYDTFNPWTLSYVNIRWDSNQGGYVCEFIY